MKNARRLANWKTRVCFLTVVVVIALLTYLQWIYLSRNGRILQTKVFLSPDEEHSEVLIPGWEPKKNLSFLSVYIRPNEDTTMITGEKVCSSDSPPHLLLIVCSAIENFEYRNAIRNTWGHDSLKNYNISVAFLMGTSQDEATMKRTEEENSVYEDLIVERFIDSKYNASLKSTFMLKWATNNCRPTKFLMKTVDNAFVNIANLALFINDSSIMRPKLLVGKLNMKENVIRDSTRDRYVPKYMYPYDTYPDYLSEAGYLMTMETAQLLYQKALITSMVHLEDVFITGLCAEAAQLNRYYDFHFYYAEHGNYKLDCDVLYQQNLIVHSYGLDTATLYGDWEELKNCSPR